MYDYEWLVFTNTTSTFRASFTSTSAMTAFINQAIFESNTGYANSKIPITLALQCIVDSALIDNPSLATVITNFANSAGDP